jgi:hypothetical protein
MHLALPGAGACRIQLSWENAENKGAADTVLNQAEHVVISRFFLQCNFPIICQQAYSGQAMLPDRP